MSENLQKFLTSFIYIVNQPHIADEIVKYQSNIHKSITNEVNKQKSLACKKGCSYCCFGWEVKLNFAELFIFLKYLNNLPEEIKEEVAKNLENFKNFYNENTPCPFLKENLCVVYEGRPFVCRTFSSYDKSICEEKKEFEFPDFIENIIKNVVIPLENKVSDEFKPLFKTKTSVKNIEYNNKDKSFYVNIFNFVKIYFKNDKFVVEELDLYKKLAGN